MHRHSSASGSRDRCPSITRRSASIPTLALSLLLLLIQFGTHRASAAEPTPAATLGFAIYIAQVELRLGQQHQAQAEFLAATSLESQARLRRGELIIERLTPSPVPNLPGAMLHHWRGTAFARGARAADFERLMTNFAAYPQFFSPQVLQSKALSQHGDHYQAIMRVRQHHVITVVLDTTYEITYGRLDAQHGYSISRSTEIREIDSPGTPHERVLNTGEEHGFLWRLNSYWSYEERDGGPYMQIESVSLTRSIPAGLGWVIGPFVESIPRESLEFTLRQTSNRLRK